MPLKPYNNISNKVQQNIYNNNYIEAKSGADLDLWMVKCLVY